MRTTSSAFTDPKNADALAALSNRLYDLAQTVRSGYATRAGLFSSIPSPAWITKMADEVSDLAKGLPLDDTGAQAAIKAAKSALSLKGAQDLLDASVKVAEVLGTEDPRVRRVSEKAKAQKGIDPDILVQSAQRAASAGDMEAATSLVRTYVQWEGRGGIPKPWHQNTINSVRKAIVAGTPVAAPRPIQVPAIRDLSAHALLKQADDLAGDLKTHAPNVSGGLDAVQRLIRRAMGRIQ